MTGFLSLGTCDKEIADFVPLLDRPTFVSANRFGTASAGQAVLVARTNAFFARPEQWHF